MMFGGTLVWESVLVRGPVNDWASIPHVKIIMVSLQVSKNCIFDCDKGTRVYVLHRFVQMWKRCDDEGIV